VVAHQDGGVGGAEPRRDQGDRRQDGGQVRLAGPGRAAGPDVHGAAEDVGEDQHEQDGQDDRHQQRLAVPEGVLQAAGGEDAQAGEESRAEGRRVRRRGGHGRGGRGHAASLPVSWRKTSSRVGLRTVTWTSGRSEARSARRREISRAEPRVAISCTTLPWRSWSWMVEPPTRSLSWEAV